jgi:hypothetical protein
MAGFKQSAFLKGKTKSRKSAKLQRKIKDFFFCLSLRLCGIFDLCKTLD